MVSNSTITDIEYFESNNTVRIFVSGEEGLGFCRVTIPHDLMDVANISVVIDDGLTPILYHNYELCDNGTHRWIYFTYEHSTHEIDIIPEFPLALLLPLLMTFTFASIVLSKKKRRYVNKQLQ